MSKKEIYVHVFAEGDREVTHIHDNPEYTVMFWSRRDSQFMSVKGENLTIYYSSDNAAKEAEIIQRTLPFLQENYPELLKG